MDNPEHTLILQGMERDTDILIVGGGLNGPALALALAATGQRVTIIDQQAETVRRNAAFDGRAYALALTSCRLLDAIGIWQAVVDKAQPMLDIKVTDAKVGQAPSPFFMHFDHAEIDEGPMGHLVEDRHLRRAFLDAMATDDRITVINGQAVVDQDVQPGGVSLTLSNGHRLAGLVLIGSDGRASSTATRAGIRRMEWGYGQTALVCALDHEHPHHGVAHQVFLPAGPLAILPLTGNRSSIVWSEQSDRAAAIMGLGDADFLEVLRPRFGDFLGRIDLVGKRFSYPLGLSLATALVADRVALVGDAGHGVHPLAGQGLNAGLRDVAALAQTLAEAARRGEDIGSAPVLARYQQWRRFDIATLALATDAFNRLFSNDNPILRLGRDLGMGLISGAPGLRRAFIREAAGLSGDLPRLMQGRPV